MSMIPFSQAYELRLAPHPAPMSVLSFKGRDALCELYRYEIEFTSPLADIPMDQVLGRPAKFIIDPIDPGMARLRKMFGERAEQFSHKPPTYTVHGLITAFDQYESSADQTRYGVVLEPVLADLHRGVTSRLFQHQSVPEIIIDILRHYGWRAGVDFQFQLRAQYARREYITQYHETTYAFIRRIAAEEGIWFRFEQHKDRAVLVFGDDLDAYARRQRTVPLRRDAGLESNGSEAIKTLERHTRRVPQSVQLHDYNHRQAGVSLLVQANAARDDTTTNAVDYHWGEHYPAPEDGQRIAQLRHQAYLSGQITYHGSGNPFALEAGEVLRVDPPVADAPHGLLVTSIDCHGGRSADYWLSFDAIPSDRIWRPAVDTAQRPRIDGVLPARIASPGNYKYAYLTEQGWYVIQLPFDLDTWSPGGSSRPVRLAKPYSGDTYGHHFPLIDGAEVAVVFTDGHPDRPVIIGALHDSLHPDLVTNLNHTRNLIRTAAQNELRMEDKEGIEHIHLTTPYQTSELNLGHMVDGQRQERGKGAELRTDEHVAVRGAKGMLLSAEGQPGGAGHQLAMQDGDATFAQAAEVLRTLNGAAGTAKALQAEVEQQRALIEQKLSQLQKPVIVATAPEGVGVASGQHVQVAARKQVFVTAGEGLDIGVMKRVTVAAGEALSFFAAKLGIRLFAAKGRVQIQAQGDAMELLSMQDMVVSSSQGEVSITGRKAVTIGDGSGAYIKLSGGKIILGSPAGEIEVKGNLTVDAAGGSSFAFPQWADAELKGVQQRIKPGFSG